MSVPPAVSSPDRPPLEERYALETGKILASGTQALVRLPMIQRQRDLAAGLNTAGYVSGYRGSPLAGFDKEMGRAGRYLRDSHVIFQPGLNEDMAATAVWGTQQTSLFQGVRYDGVFAMWYGKGPGVDRSMDVIRHANAAGTNPRGGVLLLVGDDHGAASSTLPHQSEHNLASAHVPLLSPASVAEYIDYGLLGWAMSRHSGGWIGFKCQTEIVESSTTIDINSTRPAIVLPGRPDNHDNVWIRWPDEARAMEERLEAKLSAVHDFARANGIDRTMGAGSGARLGIMATGKAWLDLLGALARLGIEDRDLERLGIRLRKVALTWPLEPQGAMRFADGLQEILVVEEKRPFLEEQLKSILYNLPASRRPKITGKADENGKPLISATAELSANIVARILLSRLGAEGLTLGKIAHLQLEAPANKESPAGLQRDPYFCSGCPHSVSTVVPKGSRAATGIGCHMMVIGLNRQTSTFTQMGGEGGSWIGLSHFTDEKHIFVNMGDGTYFHSGLLAIRAAIAAGVSATYKILYNDAVAMTGGQKHDGELTVPMIVRQVLAEGARKVAVVAEFPDIWRGRLPREVALHHRDDLDAVQRELREVKGVSVIIYDQVCAAEKRRRRKRGGYPVSPRRAFINELVCEGCGDCSATSNCISVEPKETEFGRKRAINQSSCNADLSCIKGFCPSFVTVEGAELQKPDGTALEDPTSNLPEPAPVDAGRGYCMLLAGIGGTGVVTVSAILAQAAHLDGLDILTLDQTGLAQKNGAVMSHLRLARQAKQLNAPRIDAGEADLILGFDIVVAASPAALGTMRKEQTRVVVDTHFAPTASFVKDTGIDFRQVATMRKLGDTVGDDGLLTVPATHLATALFGDPIASNMFLLGHAWQQGLVPISRSSIEVAIDLNGAGIQMNRLAFAWGRLSAHDPDKVAAMATDGHSPATEDSLDQIVSRRTRFLTDYQDSAYAERYSRLVERAREAELRVTGKGGAFSKAVAKAAFKLMAYKDEYEVARLHRDGTFRARLDGAFSGRYKLRYHLAPPLLTRIDPRTGHQGKIAFGRWIEPLFGLLANMRHLRGTRFDPFGYTKERIMERRLVADYFTLVERLAADLGAENLELAAEMAALPEQIRGFGHVKLAAVDRYEKRLAEMRRGR